MDKGMGADLPLTYRSKYWLRYGYLATLNACNQWPIDLTLQNRVYFVFIAEFVEQLPTIFPVNISSGVVGKQKLKIPFQHKHKFLKIPLCSTATSMTVYIKLKLHASDNTSWTIVLIILGIRREKLLHSWSEAALFRLIQEQMNFNRNLQPVAISPPPGDISSASNEISFIKA